MPGRYKHARRSGPHRLIEEPRAVELDHAGAVDAWLARSLDHASSIEIARLFHRALEAVWGRAVTALGVVTLTAIAERVLHNVVARHAFLAVVDPRPAAGAPWREALYERLAVVPSAELIAGLRFGLVELLAVIGTLTAEILSPELHVALQEVPPAPAHAAAPPAPTYAPRGASIKAES